MGDDEPLVQLADFDDDFEAQVVAARLRDAGVPAQVQDGTAYWGSRSSTSHYVLIRQRDLDLAREVLSDTPEELG